MLRLAGLAHNFHSCQHPLLPPGPSQSLEGPNPAALLRSPPLVATAPSGMWGRRVVAGAGKHSPGKSWPAGGVWVLLWSVGTPPQLTTPTLSPTLMTSASPTASRLPTSVSSFQEGGVPLGAHRSLKLAATSSRSWGPGLPFSLDTLDQSPPWAAEHRGLRQVLSLEPPSWV